VATVPHTSPGDEINGGDAVVAGSVKITPNLQGPGSHVANASFMLAGQYRGSGIARMLGEYALSWARQAGYRAMQFNAVAETSTCSVALWTSLGFHILATVPEAFRHPVHGYLGLHIMHRRL
jgi:GNAT superfamily N-acetyltransferase